jgi:iron complex outermembrane receptor protein
MHLYNKTVQPYADLTWKPIPNLTIEAGVKDSNFTMDLEAPLNQGTEQKDFSNNTYTNLEPHLSINYLLTPNWSVYGEVAKGIAYPIVTDEENVPADAKDTSAGVAAYNPGNLKEEQTMNFQVGTVYKTGRFNADFDAYLIDINNLVSSVVDPNDPTNNLYFQSKGAWVSGLEAEGAYYLGGGLAVYANGSLNRAVYKTNAGVPGFGVAALGAFGQPWVPNSTASIGLRYEGSGWFGSIEDKYIGGGPVYSSALTNPDLGLYGQTATGGVGGALSTVGYAYQGGFWMMDIAGGYGWKLPPGWFAHSLKIKLQLDNALNRDVQALSSVGGTPAANTYNVLPGLNYFVTFSAEF